MAATSGGNPENQLSGESSNKDVTDTLDDSHKNKDDYKLSPEFTNKLNINQPEETIEIGSDSDNDSHTKSSTEQSKSSTGAKILFLPNNTDTPVDKNFEKLRKKIVDTSASRPAVKVNSTPYKCDCGELFEKSAELAAHRRWSCALAEKKVQCTVCKSSFAHEQGLRRHMRHAHEGVYKCSKCSLQFHNLIRLSRHWMEWHYDENKSEDKLKCFLCGDDTFPSKFDLESHLLNHKYKKTLAKKIVTTPTTTTTTSEIIRADCAQTSSGNSEENSFNKTLSSVGGNAQNEKTVSLIPSPRPTADDDVIHIPSPSQPLPHRASDDEPKSLPLPQPSTADSTSTTSSQAPHHHFPPHFLHPRLAFPVCRPPFRPPFVGSLPFHHPPHHHPPHHHHPHHHSDHHYPPHHHHPHHHTDHHRRRHGLCHRPPDKAEPPSSSNENQELPLHFPDFPAPPHWPLSRRHHDHHKKWKWKKNYFKNVMSQNLSPWEAGQYAAMTKRSNLPSTASPNQADTGETYNVPLSRGVTMTTDSVSDPTSFKMACKFCGQTLEQGTALQHRLNDCPALAFSFKCNVCGKAFRKYHKLIQHQVRQGHFDVPTANQSSSSCADSVTNLQDKLNAVGISSTSSTPPVSIPLGPQSSDRLTGNISHHNHPEDSNEDSNVIMSGQKDGFADSKSTTSPMRKVKTEPEESESQNDGMETEDMASAVIGKEPSFSDTSQKEQVSLSSNFVCCVCCCVLDSAALLSIHLNEHITHVTAVLKVQEWKKKSSKYFFDGSIEESSVSSIVSGMDSSLDEASTITETSFQDTGSSAQLSNASSMLGNPSEIADTVKSSEKWLKPHCKKKHKCGKKLFPCEFCDQTFSFKKALRFHMKEKHGCKRPHLECPVCQRKFSWKSRGQFYERHLSSHYGIKVFKHKCDVCDKTFLEKGKLQAHVMAKHTADLSHICQLCGKGYASKSSLTRHLRQHTGEKPHQCDVCSESFLEKRELLRHMAVHTGTPAFVCPHCEQGFTLKTSLDMHMKRKHQKPSL